MNIKTYRQIHGGMRSFVTTSLFPVGANKFDKSDARKSVLSKTSSDSAALEVMDLGWLAAGTCISFCCDIKINTQMSGAPSISIESRNGARLSDGRKIVNIGTTNSKEWETVRCDWIVSEFDNWITLSYGASTPVLGQFEFRNPRISITNDQARLPINFSLLRSGNVWCVDTGTFIYNGAVLVSANGDSIEVSWPYVNNIRSPIVHTTIDTGFSLLSAGCISCGPHSVSNSGCKIRLIKPDGSFVTDVTNGTTLRIHVSVNY
ncbi:hypothetical protein GBT15_02765 [Escherichia coli]|uniref:hypothetical protein n=1 Tax=Escherichia coli TaxID=562 RepID=UPI0014837FA7|nr:hypothetical protein [Escherichia coli]NNR90753.1 hypothetical protein [Escherichia coli]NNR90808.1 hypothetical protein [Escherichia coli]